MRRYLFLPFVVAVAIAIALITRVPPSHDGGTGYSLKSAQATLHAIASEPRPVGSPGHVKTRDWLVSRFESMELEVSTQAGVGVRQANFDRRRNGSVNVAPYENIIAVLPGRHRADKAVALMAHYDSAPWANGAADDGAGVAALIETARVLSMGPKPMRDVIFIATDAEELGLIGAQEFFDRHILAKKIGAVVNVEARGSRGRAIMFQTSRGNAGLIGTWASHAISPTGNSLANDVYKILPNDTDLSVPLAKGVIGINAAFIDRLLDYHMPTDNIDNLDVGALRHLGNFALTTTRALANTETLPAQGADSAYFDFFGLFVIRYPMWMGWVLVAFGFGLLHTAQVQRLGVGWRKALYGTAAVLALTIGVGAISHLVASFAYGNGMISLRERINEMGAVLWIYVAFAAGSILVVKPRAAMWTGSVILMLLCALAAQIWMPGASWLFDWGGLIGAILLNLAARSGWQSSAVQLASAITGGLWGSLLLIGVIVTYVSVAPMTPAPVALVIPFAITLIGPVIMAFGNLDASRRIGAGLVVLSLSGAIWFAFDGSFSERKPKPGDLFYYSDRESGKNFWATSSTTHELPGGKGSQLSPKGFENLKWKVVGAPAAALAPPEIQLSERDGQVFVSMKSKAAPRMMNFIVKPSTALKSTMVNNRRVHLPMGKPTRIGWRAETPNAELLLQFESENGGSLSIDYLYAVETMPPGSPEPGGPNTDWAQFNGTRVLSDSIELKFNN